MDPNIPDKTQPEPSIKMPREIAEVSGELVSVEMGN